MGDDTPKKPKPELKTRRLSQAKKNSVVSETMSSDGSNSSRKENVPPELMICIDMNTGLDSGSGGEGVRRTSNSGTGSSPYRNKYITSGQGNNPNMRNGGSPTRDPSHWRSYSTEPDPIDPSASVIPKFDIDPDVPLETMVPLKTTSESEQSDGGSTRPHQTGLIIGDEMLNVDPTTQYEMQRKKERIMLQSLRRKQQAEENKNKIDAEARRKREEEAKNEEEKLRKK